MKKKVLISLAALGLLMGGLVGCNNNKEPADSTPSKKPDTTSQKADSSSAPAPVVHKFDEMSKYAKNADGKNMILRECTDNDNGKQISIAFSDYSNKSDEFGDTSGYSKVPEALRKESYLLAKNSNISWKINVDKAIKDAKISFGAVYTGSDHGTQELASKYTARVNDNDFVNWQIDSSVTYADAGLSQTERAYVTVLTADLKEGENIISLGQLNGGYRLLFGGYVLIEYTGDATIVAAEQTGYEVNFAAENCKVLIYAQGTDKDPVEGVKGYTLDDDAAPAKYSDANKDFNIPEVKPEINFKIVCDEGFYADGNDIVISGTMGNEWNKLCSEGENWYAITKVKANLNVQIKAKAITGEETEGYTAKFTAEHCTVVVYQGEKKVDDAGEATNIDTADANGFYFSRVKKGGVSKAKAQFNFEVIPEEGYEFAHGFSAEDLAEGLSPVNVSFTTGSYGNFKGVGNIFQITKVATNLTINIVCTAKAAA